MKAAFALRAALLALLVPAAAAQSLHTIAPPDCAPPAKSQDLRIFRDVQTHHPFTVAGPLGGIMGQQDGGFEVWVWPVKVLSNLRIAAQLADYPVPIDVNEQAATIDVRPGCTIITYAHAAFTVRQIMFAPRDSGPGTGIAAVFTVDSARPITLTLSFTPEVRRMWPAPNYGTPSAEWVANGGFYVLHTDSPDVAAAVAIPGAAAGILPPYQEKPRVYPLQFVLHVNAGERNKAWPLLIAVANGNATQGGSGRTGNNGVPGSGAALGPQLAALNDALPQAFANTQQYWRNFLATRLQVETPDSQFNDAIQWAEVSIGQSQVRWHPERNGGETGMTAGWFSSGDSARPGFGWFFGRDTLWTMFAINSEGDFALARRAFDFLLARQRADGKIMHEFSQTADEVDWAAMPYEYAAADATPLMLMAMVDYVSASGDTTYLQQHWLQIKKAWQFESTQDADGDGIYDNAQGTGWVESWPPTMPKQEIYLAALDEQASGAMARMATRMKDATTAQFATVRAQKIAATIQREYAPAAAADGMYAFSYDSGRQDTTATIYPAVAWWDGHYALPDPDRMFARWASPEFSPGWGTRDVSSQSKIYDPISYHQGSIWPLFTGWTAMAEYRAGHADAGFRHLMENVELTYAQDLGAVTELLSGDFYAPLGRSSSHQMWSSAMTLAPAVRGLLGIEVDAPNKTIHLYPQLPPGWSEVAVTNVPVGIPGARLVLRANAPATLTGAPGWKLEQPAVKKSIAPVAPKEFDKEHFLPEPGSRGVEQ